MLTDTSGGKKGMGKQEFLNRMADSLTAAEEVGGAAAGGEALRFASSTSVLGLQGHDQGRAAAW